MIECKTYCKNNKIVNEKYRKKTIFYTYLFIKMFCSLLTSKSN